MNQLNEEQRERVKQIRERQQARHVDAGRLRDEWCIGEEVLTDIDFLLSLIDSQAADPYPPVTDTRRGRCRHNVPTCGECQINEVLAHVDDKRKVSNNAATAMRDACVDGIKSLRRTPHGAAYNNALNDAIHKVESLTLDPNQ